MIFAPFFSYLLLSSISWPSW